MIVQSRNSVKGRWAGRQERSPPFAVFAAGDMVPAMRIMTANMRKIGVMGAIVVIGSLAGSVLGSFVADDSALVLARAGDVELVGRPPGTPPPVSEAWPRPAREFETACFSCGPTLAEMRAMEEQRRLERLRAGDRRAGRGYSYDAFGNIVYLDVAATRADSRHEVVSRERETSWR